MRRRALSCKDGAMKHSSDIVGATHRRAATCIWEAKDRNIVGCRGISAAKASNTPSTKDSWPFKVLQRAGIVLGTTLRHEVTKVGKVGVVISRTRV